MNFFKNVLILLIAAASGAAGYCYVNAQLDRAAFVFVAGDTAVVAFVKGDGTVDHHPLASEGTALQERDLLRLQKIPKPSKIGLIGVCPASPAPLPKPKMQTVRRSI